MKPEKLYIGEYNRKKGHKSTMVSWKEILAFIGGIFFIALFTIFIFSFTDCAKKSKDACPEVIKHDQSGNIKMINYPNTYRLRHDKTGAIYYEGTTENGTKMRIYID